MAFSRSAAQRSATVTVLRRSVVEQLGRPHRRRVAIAGLVGMLGVLAFGCGDSSPIGDARPIDAFEPFDAMVDAPGDAPIDGSDAMIDAPIDAPVDGMIDAPIDAMIDAPIDAPIDAMIDAPIDAPVDAMIDAPIDAPSGCPVATWCRETAPIASTISLKSVHAVSATDVFAVGTAGTIIRRQNGAWAEMTSNSTAHLRGVWAASGTDAWAVGLGGTILRWNGTTWSAVTGVTSVDLEAVWGSSANDVWMVGPTTVVHFTGTGYTITGRPGILLAVTGTSPTDVWVAGETAYVQHYNGVAWTTMNPGVGTDFFAIRALGTANVWASNAFPNKQTVNWLGSTWAPHAVTAAFKNLWGNAANNLWGVDALKIGHWTGAAWTLETPAFVTLPLRGVTGVGTENWVVGDGAMIAYRR